MTLTQDEVLDILRMVDQAPVGRLLVQSGDFRLEVVKGNGEGERRDLDFPAPVDARPVPSVPSTSPEPEKAKPTPLDSGSSCVTITAPLLGIFYRRADPGAPVYVEEGSRVEEDTTVALIEVMKLFNPVKAGVRGRIRRVCVENGALVEYQQTLFEIDPE